MPAHERYQVENVIASQPDPIVFETDGIDFPSVERRFRAINEGRIQRTREALRERQRDFLELLPLLFEVNHPMLPGYVARNAPAGIPGYEPNATTLHLAKRLAKSFQYRKPVQSSYPISAIYLMGSPGTVAYSENSDFDIWLCHEPTLAVEETDLLQQKATAIERWAEGLALEVHFFLINPATFGSEEKELSSESSGTAQHNLLLEEFYRTSVLVAGRFPLWWFVPPQYEADYDLFVEELKRKRFKPVEQAIDFGGLAHVPAEEFFGAAVWQLSKGIDSPYKSALKLLLIEAYAAEYPYINLLSRHFKHLVYQGDDDLDHLDPYLMMLDKVEEYLRGRDEPDRLELARRCFYFKINQQLSREGKKSGWRRRLLNSRIRSWGWTKGDLALMDVRDQWKVQRVTEERRILFDALAASYRFLSDFARRYAGVAMISQRDLTILGRKLYSAYERKAGKIELLNRGISNSLRESHLTIYEARDQNQQPVWVLYAGVVPPEHSRRETPLKRTRSIVELAAWCHFNGVIDQQTAVAVHQRGSGFTTKDFTALVRYLREQFPAEVFAGAPVDEYMRPARLRRAALFVNMGVTGTERAILTREGSPSGSTDALTFGMTSDNLVVSVDLVLVTTWNEVMSHRYSGSKGLAECLRDYFKWAPLSAAQMPPAISAHGLSAYKGLTVSHRLVELFGDVADCYYGGKNPLTARYVLAIGRAYYLFQFESDTLRYQEAENLQALLRLLGRPQGEYSPVVVDRYALRGTLLPLIYARNKPGYVQFFYRPVGSEVEVYVLDERGSLFYQRTSFFSGTTLLNQFSRFFESTLNRMNFLMQDGEAVSVAEGVEFFAVGKDAVGHPVLERKAPEFSDRERRYFSLQVMVDVDEKGRTVFALYCDEQEFSTLEHGNNLFRAVVDYVLELRKNGQPYPIYITDISLARPLLGAEGTNRLQTVQFLGYKQRIEEQLNRAMERRGTRG